MATLALQVPDEALAKPRAFLALALASGNVARASEACGVPETTLRRWLVKDAAEYERVRTEVAPKLEAVILNDLRGFVLEASRVKAVALQKTLEALEADAIPQRDLPGALRNITTAEAISVDKIMVLSGRPTSVVEHRSLGQLVARLAAIGAVVDGSAEELPAGT